jgi:putative hydrolase of the HAD superfamily
VDSKGLLLDFGGVLTPSLYGRMADFCVAAGLPAGAITEALQTPEGLIVTAQAEAGQLPQRDFELMLARQLGLPADGLIARLLNADFQVPRPAAVNLARRTRAVGLPTGLLSNSWGAGGHDVYTGYDLNALFDVVVISHLVGVRKPERPIFELAAAKLGRVPAQCVFVDDTRANVTAARELGMAAVHYTGEHGQLAEVERLLGLPNKVPSMTAAATAPSPRRRHDG